MLLPTELTLLQMGFKNVNHKKTLENLNYFDKLSFKQGFAKNNPPIYSFL